MGLWEGLCWRVALALLRDRMGHGHVEMLVTVSAG